METVPPGSTFEGDLARQPFAELLVQILRRNLDGCLELTRDPFEPAPGTEPAPSPSATRLGAASRLADGPAGRLLGGEVSSALTPRNRILFRGGVPFVVDLEDFGPSLFEILIAQGALGREEGLWPTPGEGASEGREAGLERRVGRARLREARIARARAQLAGLVGLREARFRFRVGLEVVDPSAITLLEPLAVLFDGLRRFPDAALPFLPPDGARLRLSASYPAGLDPFGFGAALDGAVREEPSVFGLLARGRPRGEAAAAIACLSLAQMLESDDAAHDPGSALLSGSNAVLPSDTGSALPPGPGSALPPDLGATPPSGTGVALPPGPGATLPSGTGAALPPGPGAALPPGPGAAPPSGTGAALPPGPGRALPPRPGAGPPSGTGVTLSPGPGVALSPGPGFALPPRPSAARPSELGAARLPSMEAAFPPEEGLSAQRVRRPHRAASGRLVGSSSRPAPSGTRAINGPGPSEEPVDSPPAEGLVIYRRSGSRVVPDRPPAASTLRGHPEAIEAKPGAPAADEVSASSAVAVDDQVESNPSDQARRAIARRLDPFEGKSYFQLLRVVPETEPAQLERAYRFLARRLQEDPTDPGSVALAGLLHEAYVFLREPHRATRYALAEGSERRAFEVEPKVERAIRALGEHRDEEARYLMRWAMRLAPDRSELGALYAAVEWLSTLPEERRFSPRPALSVEAHRTGDRYVKLALALVQAEEGDARGARATLAALSGLDHHPALDRFRPRRRG